MRDPRTRRRTHVLSRATVAAIAFALPAQALAQVKAFAEAEGFARFAAGARTNLAAASVYHVTNLNDSGAGSFRDAVSQPNRFVVFDVSGVVRLTSGAVQVQDNLTIAGQTAPGGGISFYGDRLAYHGADNTISRYLRVRKGTTTGRNDALSIARGRNMMFDHMSVTWGNDETFSMNPDSGQVIDNITIQNSIIGQGLDNVNHSAGGLMTIGDGRFSILRSLFIDNETRSPKVRGNNQFINNAVYNWTTAAYIMGDTSGTSNANVEGNYFIEGPNNGGSPFSSGTSSFHIYARDNWIDADKDGVLDGTPVTSYPGADVIATPHDFPRVGIDSAQAALQRIIQQVGPNLHRDEVDARLIQELQSYGTLGQIVVREGDLYPGYPGALPTAPKPTDTDNDGMPDAWESARGLNPNSAADFKTLNHLGYTMLEEYFNGLVSSHTDKVWTAAAGTWPTNANWGGAAPTWDEDAFVHSDAAGNSGNVTITGPATAFTLNVGGGATPSANGEGVTINGGGNLYVSDVLHVGAANRGRVTVNAGGVAESWNVVLGSLAGGHVGTLAIEGGTLRTSRIVATNAGSGVTFNGGTLQAAGTFVVTAPITLGAGGGVVDSNGFTGTISGAIGGAGTLTKRGVGVADLTGANSFTGGVVLEGGSLGISSDANLGGATTPITFNGGLLRINGTGLTTLGSHPVNFSTFNGGFDIAAAGNTFNVPQSLGGTGSLTKQGAGTLVLSGVNSYTGGTFLQGGMLNVTQDANLGANGSPITFAGGGLRIVGTGMANLNNHAPTFSSGTSTLDIATAGHVFTIGQVIGGSGGITKAGPGTLVLSGLNSFTGATTITGGTLRVGHPLALRRSTVVLNTAGVTFDLNNLNPTLGGLSGNQGLDLKGNTIYVGTNTASYSGVISDSVGTGAIVKNGNGTWTVSGLSTYTGTTTVTAGMLSLGSLTNGGAPSTLGASSASPANLILDGGTLGFAASGFTDRGFTLTNRGGGLYAAGTTFSFGGNVVATGAGDRSLIVNIDTQSSALNGNILDTTDPAGGKTSVVLTGSGRLFFDVVAKTFSGDTSVQGGTLLIYKTDVMPYGPGKGNLNISAGAFADVRQSVKLNALVGAGSVFGTAGRTITLGHGDASGTFSGVIGSGLNLAKTGSGTQIFSGANTYTGTTTVSQGVLQFNAANSIGGSGATLMINAGGIAAAGYALDQPFLNRINPASTGTVALAVASANSLIFSTTGLANVSLGATANVSYTGTMTPNGTTYRFGGGTATLTLPNANAVTGARDVISVPGGVTALNGLNTYTGTTTVRGTLAVATMANGGASSGIGASTADAANLVLDGGTLRAAGATDRLFTLTANGGTIDAPADLLFTSTGEVAMPAGGARTLTLTGASTASHFAPVLADPVGGITSLIKEGNGRWFLDAATRTYSGATVVNAGTLYLSSVDSLPSGPGRGSVTVNAAGTLSLGNNSITLNGLSGPAGATVAQGGANTRTFTVGNGNANGTFNGTIAGSPLLSVRKTGSGTQSLLGTNTWGNGTIVDEGTLVVGSLPRNGGIVVNGGTLRFTAKPVASDPSGTSVATSLTVDETDARLDLTNNALIVDYSTTSPAEAIRGLLRSGLVSGFGIVSTTADASRRIGYADNATFGALSFGGVDVDASSVLLKTTRTGDANLDGAVDFDDLLALAQNYGGSGVWTLGDFNYDAAVGFDDLLALAQQYGTTGGLTESPVSAEAFAADWALAQSLVPEPSMLSLLGLGALLARRRRS